MLFEIIVYALTALAALVVVLTRRRLGADGSVAGRLSISRRLLLAHTVAGTAAWVTWVAFLLFPDDSVLGSAVVGIFALGLWWVTTLIGLLILVRWLPARGKHARPGATDSWSRGPWLSVLAHVGLLLGVLTFSYAYLTASV